MLLTRASRPAIRTLRGWAISVLQEAGAIRDVLLGMCVIMAVAALVALRGLKRGVQQETGEAAAPVGAGLSGEGPDAGLYRSGS